VGEYYDIVLRGSTERVYGTSASSQSWAALISVINDYRASEGKSTLGFLNPLLYGSARSALRDITTVVGNMGSRLRLDGTLRLGLARWTLRS
jgi:tripeptidyl-peptidase-1